jgi:predicted nucleic acid-binding protein
MLGSKRSRKKTFYVSVLTFAEIRRGIELLPKGKRRTQLEEWLDELNASFQDRLLPVTKGIGDRWAVLSGQAKQRGVTITLFDGLIAATALENDLTIATRNVKDFAGLGAQIINPWES